MTTEHEVRALVAERYAAAADTADEANDAAAMLRAADKLLEVLDTLPVRTTSGGGGAGDGSGGGARGQLLSIMDRPAEVGDAADA